MHLYHNVSGWTLLFALLTFAVICDGFAIWMGWLSTH
jgi:competence protein ComGF